MTPHDIQTLAQQVIESSIKEYLDDKKEPATHHAVLDRIFPVERRIRSIIGGLETSLGVNLWENIAKKIAAQYGFSVLDKKKFEMPKDIPAPVSSLMTSWMAKRNSRGANISLDTYISELKQEIGQLDATTRVFGPITSGEGVDLWLLRDGVEYAFDIKTVQPNKKNFNSFNSTLMQWYAYRFLKTNDIDFKAWIVIPYSPFEPYTTESWWENIGTRSYPLLKGSDILVQDDFWDFLTGEPNTWQKIVSAIDNVATQGLAEQYKRLFYTGN